MKPSTLSVHTGLPPAPPLIEKLSILSNRIRARMGEGGEEREGERGRETGERERENNLHICICWVSVQSPQHNKSLDLGTAEGEKEREGGREREHLACSSKYSSHLYLLGLSLSKFLNRTKGKASCASVSDCITGEWGQTYIVNVL
jgi:hypothetical protein